MTSQALATLRVKIRSLADEARTIKGEERKAKSKRQTALVNSLCSHRKLIVRPEARSTLLAYGFLRSVPYAAIESDPKTIPNWKRVRKMVERFTDATSEKELIDVESRMSLWRDGAR